MGRRYVYGWADGCYTPLREEGDEKLCLLVIIGVIPEGRKAWGAISDGPPRRGGTCCAT